MRININTSAVNTHRIMTQNSQRQDKNLERLASGLKINRGADGPAQLQVSERLRSQVAGLGQAIDNSENAVSVLQTAEAALDEVSRALVNARQLAVHAANEGANDEFMLPQMNSNFRTSLVRSTGSPPIPSTERTICLTAVGLAMELQPVHIWSL